MNIVIQVEEVVANALFYPSRSLSKCQAAPLKMTRFKSNLCRILISTTTIISIDLCMISVEIIFLRHCSALWMCQHIWNTYRWHGVPHIVVRHETDSLQWQTPQRVGIIVLRIRRATTIKDSMAGMRLGVFLVLRKSNPSRADNDTDAAWEQRTSVLTFISLTVWHSRSLNQS